VTKHINIRGAAPVGHVADLEPFEATAVLYLRLWWDSSCGKDQVRNEIVSALGSAAGRTAVDALEDLCGLCMRHGRRALMHHQPTSKCLGADEACFANLVAIAAEGEREDALFIATLLVRPDVTPHLAAAAQTFGLALKRLALRTNRRTATVPSQTLH
jgi:hypothetical protein